MSVPSVDGATNLIVERFMEMLVGPRTQTCSICNDGLATSMLEGRVKEEAWAGVGAPRYGLMG